MLPVDIKRLIDEQQWEEGGEFLPGIDVGQYFEKIQNKAEVLCYYKEGECAGFVAFYCNDVARHKAFITLVLTRRSARGRGVAASLLRAAISMIEERGFLFCELEVKKSNRAALALYEKWGFVIVGEKQDKYLMSLSF